MKFQGVDYYQIDELLSEDERMAREFLENEVEPLVVDAFHEEKPFDLEKIAPKTNAIKACPFIILFISESIDGTQKSSLCSIGWP